MERTLSLYEFKAAKYFDRVDETQDKMVKVLSVRLNL